jgi:hypothetical protein
LNNSKEQQTNYEATLEHIEMNHTTTDHSTNNNTNNSTLDKTTLENTTTFHLLPASFAIVRLQPSERLPLWLQTTALDSSFLTISQSEYELSVVCEERHVPDSVLKLAASGEAQISRHWRVLRLGTMDLSLVGIAARFTHALAEAGINVNVVSTFDTDYVFISERNKDAALNALRNAGYTVILDGAD